MNETGPGWAGDRHKGRQKKNSYPQWPDHKIHPCTFCTTLTILVHPSSVISLGSGMYGGTANKRPQMLYRQQQLKSVESRRWANIQASRLQAPVFMKVQRTTTMVSCYRPSKQTHFTEKPPLCPACKQIAFAQTKFVKRHWTGKIMTINQHTISNSILRQCHPCLRFLSWGQYHTIHSPSVPRAHAESWRVPQG